MAAAAAAAAAAACCWEFELLLEFCCDDDEELDPSGFLDLLELLLPAFGGVPPAAAAAARAVVGSSPAAAIMAARLCASIPDRPGNPAKLANRFMLFRFPKPPRPAKPGIPPNGIPSNGFFGSKLPSPGMLDSKLAFSPARPGNCILAALLLLCFFDGVDEDC